MLTGKYRVGNLVNGDENRTILAHPGSDQLSLRFKWFLLSKVETCNLFNQ